MAGSDALCRFQPCHYRAAVVPRHWSMLLLLHTVRLEKLQRAAVATRPSVTPVDTNRVQQQAALLNAEGASVHRAGAARGPEAPGESAEHAPL